MDSQPDGLLNRIAEKLGWNTRKDELPTDIAGLTYTFRPGRKYNPNAKQRTGFETTYDALKGFDRYIETAADVIFHTEDIQRLRALEDAVRFKNSEKGIKQEVQDIRADESLTEEQRESRVAELYSKGKSHLSHFVQELNEYTNKQPIAPPVQGPAGRPERKRHGRACCRADEVHDRGVFVQ